MKKKVMIKYIQLLTSCFELIRDIPKLDEEDRFWKLTSMKHTINWIRRELGYELLKFKKGTWIIEKESNQEKEIKPN